MLALLAAAALLSPGLAAAAGAPCELHLFAIDLGGGPPMKGNLLVRPLPSSDDPLALINIMSPHDRMAELTDADYRHALGLSEDTPVLRHWDVAITADVRKSLAPLVETPSRCHAELIGYTSMGMMASRSRSGKDEVRVSLVFREFTPGAATPFEVRDGGFGAVDTEKKVGREAALQSLHAASVAIIEDFGARVAKKRTRAQ